MGMGEEYEGPIEDPEWLKIPRTSIPGAPELSQRIITEMMQTVDLSYAKEWKMDHGIMVPLNFLTPRYDMPIIPANINCQGPPLTPLKRANSGKINEAWDREYLDAWTANDKERLLSYTDEDTLREAGQGGFEIRTLTAISGLCEGDPDFLNNVRRGRNGYLIGYIG